METGDVFFNNGMLICFGLDTQHNASNTTVTFPLAYVSNVIMLITKYKNDTSSDQNAAVVKTVSLTSANINKVDKKYVASWITIGN